MVKPGDIVRVKVLDVDIPRKRISLTLRLDDEGRAGSRRRARRAEDDPQEQANQRQPNQRQGGGQKQAGRGGGRRPEPEPQGALADALRLARAARGQVVAWQRDQAARTGVAGELLVEPVAEAAVQGPGSGVVGVQVHGRHR